MKMEAFDSRDLAKWSPWKWRQGKMRVYCVNGKNEYSDTNGDINFVTWLNNITLWYLYMWSKKHSKTSQKRHTHGGQLCYHATKNKIERASHE